MKRRFRVSAVLTIPVFLLAMGEMLPNFHTFVSPRLSIWVQFVLATPVVLWGGLSFFERAWASIKNVSPNMFTLIAIGTGAAYLLSIAALFAPELFPVSMRSEHTGLVSAYFESAAVITVGAATSAGGVRGASDCCASAEGAAAQKTRPARAA
jgi:Cu+-exporting ATPase